MLDTLKIDSTPFTPNIELNVETFQFSFDGVSRPENVIFFYNQVLDWVKRFESELFQNEILGGDKRPLTLVFKFAYFNSASAKMIFGMLEVFANISKMGYPVLVNWYYEVGDDKMKDDGLELSEASGLEFNYIEFE